MTPEFLLVAHVPAFGFPELASHIREALEAGFAARVTQVLPSQLTAELVESGRWAFMLALHGGSVDPDLVWRAKRRGMRTAVWITEAPYEIDLHTPRWLEPWDHVFTNDSASVEVYREAVRNVTYLPWCTNPRVYRPSSVSTDYRSDVCLVGQGFPNRMALLNAIAPALERLHVKLIGDWTGWGDALAPRLKRFVRPGVYDAGEVARYFCGAAINLNIHRDPMPETMPNNRNSRRVPARSPNNRLFDIAACGAFQLVDDSRPDIRRLYREGEEVVLFHDARDLAEKIEYYLAHPDERRRIAEAARRRTLWEHTFRHRLAVIVRSLMQPASGPTRASGDTSP